MRIIQADFTSVNVKQHPLEAHKNLTMIEFYSVQLDLVTILEKKELVILKNKINIRLKELEEMK